MYIDICLVGLENVQVVFSKFSALSITSDENVRKQSAKTSNTRRHHNTKTFEKRTAKTIKKT